MKTTDKECCAQNIARDYKLEKQGNFRSNSSLVGQQQSHLLKSDNPSEQIQQLPVTCPKQNQTEIATIEQPKEKIQNQCGYTNLSALINSNKFQLFLMIMLPEILLIIVSVMLVELNLSYSSASLSKLSTSLFESSVEFVRIQASALQMSLELQLQNEVILMNAMHSLQFKAIRGEVLFQEKFHNPILNIEQTYQNKDDAYLLQQLKNNLTLFLSSWHQKNALEVNQLDEFSQTQLDITSTVDFLLRSALFTNQADLSTTNKLLIYSYFFSFGHDGMLIFTKGVNMTYARFVDQPPCLSGIYHLDTRCRPYFYSGKNKDILTAFPPTVLQLGSSNQFYAASGFCKRQPVPLSIFEGFQVNSLNNGVYSQMCNAIKLEQISFIFDRFSSDPKVVIMLLDPVSLNLVFQSRQVLDQSKIISFKEAYLSNLDEQNRDYFLRQVKQYAAERMDEKCFEIGQENYARSEDFSFNYTEQGEETMVFINHISSFDLEQNHTDDVYGEDSPVTLDSGINEESQNSKSNSKRRICIAPFWIFIIVIPKAQLMYQVFALEDQMNTINIAFQSVIYVGVGGSVLIFCIYLKSILFMMNAPVKRLTQILKELHLCEARVAYNHLSGEDEEESQDIFYSYDAKVLFESFKKLFVTLVFATQSMLGDKQCQTLLDLNQQIVHFKQLKNYRAVGVCANNIGNIHHNNSRYIEALESYQIAIIYANYELERYKEKEEEIFSQYVALLNDNNINKFKVKMLLNNLHSFFNVFGKRKITNLSTSSKSATIPDTKQKANQQEIYWVLYNRKFNFLKSLIALMRQKDKAYTDWPTAKIIAEELQDISDNKLLPNEKRKIILNQIEMYIHCNTEDVTSFMKILNENKVLIQSFEFNKLNETELTNLNSQSNKISSRKRDSNAENRKKSRSTRITQQKRQTLHSNSNFLSISNANTTCNRLDSSSRFNINQKINHNPEVIQISTQQFHQTLSPETHIRLGSLTPNEKDDNVWLSQSQLNSSNIPSAEINNQTIDKLHESGSNLLDFCASQQLKSDENHLNPQQQFKMNHQNNRVVLKHFTMKHSRESERKPPKQYQNNKKLNKIELVMTESNLHKKSKNSNNNNNVEYLTEHPLPTLEKNTPFLSTRPINYSESSRINPKNTLLPKNLMKSQMESSEKFSFLQRSKSKYLDIHLDDIPVQLAAIITDKTIQKDKTHENLLEISEELSNYDNNPYMQETFLFQGIIRWEEATVSLLKRQLYESAVQFTLFFEDTYNVLPVMQYQAFDMLAFIFSSARLRDNILERMASKYEQETSFKISVLVFGSETETDQKMMSFGGKKEQNQEGDKCQQSLNLEGKKTRQLPEVMERLWEDITQNVMKNQEDMIGVLVGSYDQFNIEEKISMVSSKFLQLNLNLFKQAISNLINKKEDLRNPTVRKTEEQIMAQANINNEDFIHNSIQISNLQLTSWSQNKLENHRRLSFLNPQTPQDKGNPDLSPFNNTQYIGSELVHKKITAIQNRELNEIKQQNFLKTNQMSELTGKRGNEIISFSKLMVEKPSQEVNGIECQESLCNQNQVVLMSLENEDSNNNIVACQQKQQISRQNIQQHPTTNSQYNLISQSCSDNDKLQDKLPGEGLLRKLIKTIKTQEYTESTPFRNTKNIIQEPHAMSFRINQEKSPFTTLQQLPDPKIIQQQGKHQKSSALSFSSELRYLFLMGIRKSLQSVLLSQGVDLNCIYFQVQNAETRVSQIADLELLKEKRSLNHFELHKKQFTQITKKFSVVVTEFLFFIKPNDKALAVLLENFLRFSISLFILCLHEDQATQFKSQLPLEYADIVFVFTSEKSLVNHLIAERAPNNFDFFPLSVEHF